MQINPIAVLAVAAGLNGLLTLAGRDSPAVLKLLAAAGVGVALVGNLRNAIERQEAKEAEEVANVESVSVEKPVVMTEPIKSVVKDIDFVSSRLLNWY